MGPCRENKGAAGSLAKMEREHFEGGVGIALKGRAVKGPPTVNALPEATAAEKEEVQFLRKRLAVMVEGTLLRKARRRGGCCCC